MSDINLFTAARAKKSLGQHFLRDERVVQRIVDLLRPEEGDQIMEIGPGPGALTALLRPVLPFLLAFAAGAMVYVVLEELNPQAQTGPHGHTGTMGAAAGFALMMAMDVALG